MGKFKDSIHDIILGEKISDNIYLDNNGQLICENVVLARTGNYDYREDELLENGSIKLIKDSKSITYSEYLKHIKNMGLDNHSSTLFKEARRGLDNLKRMKQISGGWWNEVDVDKIYSLVKSVDLNLSDSKGFMDSRSVYRVKDTNGLIHRIVARNSDEAVKKVRDMAISDMPDTLTKSGLRSVYFQVMMSALDKVPTNMWERVGDKVNINNSQITLIATPNGVRAKTPVGAEGTFQNKKAVVAFIENHLR